MQFANAVFCTASPVSWFVRHSFPGTPYALDVDIWCPKRDPEELSGRVTQVSTFYYRVMGQSQSAPYLQVLKHTLAVCGVHVSSSDIECVFE